MQWIRKSAGYYVSGKFEIRKVRPGVIRGEGNWELYSPVGFDYLHSLKSAKAMAELMEKKGKL